MNKNKRSPILYKKQRVGLFLLLGIGIGILTMLIIFIFFSSPSSILDLKKEEIYYSNKKEKISSDTIKNYNPFYFNPNNISYEELLRFGFTEKQSKNILNYLKAGGVFRKKEDFRKLYCINDSLYNQIEKWIIINNDEKQISNTLSKIDLNKADSVELQKLKGIGRVLSIRIFLYGNKLGGYTNINQLKEVYGISEDLYEGIKPYLIINNPEVRKINVNKVDINKLSFHPYINYESAKRIVSYREEMGGYKNISQLKEVLERSTFDKIYPYLEL